MDLQMPIMNGFECTQKIRELERANNLNPMYITGLSGHSDDTMKTKCYEAGMNNYSKHFGLVNLRIVTKPFDAEAIRDLIRNVNII